MPYCAHCGNFVDENTQFCGSCGAKQNAQPQQQTYYQQPQQQQTYQTYQTYQQPQQSYYQPASAPVSKKCSVLALVFGIVALFSGIFCIYPIANIFFLPMAIVFLIIAKKQRNNFVNQNGSDNGMSRTGNILAIIAIPITILFSLLSLVYYGLIFG
jgi:hypothetical protein